MSKQNTKTAISASSFTESSMDPDLRSIVNQVLISNNCIPQIHASLLHECQATGFLEQIRARATDLLRSGKANTFSECLEQIMAMVRLEGIDADASTGANGSAASEHLEKLVVPRSVVKEGYEALETQLGPHIEVTGKGEGSSSG